MEGRQKRQEDNLQDEGASSEHRNPNNACDPMDATARRPCEEKQACWQKDNREQGGYQAVLLRAEAILLDVWLQIEPDVRAVHSDANDGADDDARKDDSLLAEVEAVDADIDEGERLKVRVVDAVDKGRV